MSNLPASEQFRRAGEKWASLNAAADMLEEGKMKDCRAANTRTPRGPELTVDEARRLFSYNPQTGEIVWRVNARRGRAGAIAGTLSKGYWRIGYNGRVYLAHRLAWFLYYGRWPSNFVDHINRNPSDNRLSNLRDIGHRANIMNSKVRTDNTSGFRGVCKRDGKWWARQRIGNKRVSLGIYDTPEAASAAIEKAGGHK